MKVKAIMQYFIMILGMLLTISCESGSSLVADLGGKPDLEEDVELTGDEKLVRDYNRMGCDGVAHINQGPFQPYCIDI